MCTVHKFIKQFLHRSHQSDTRHLMLSRHLNTTKAVVKSRLQCIGTGNATKSALDCSLNKDINIKGWRTASE